MQRRRRIHARLRFSGGAAAARRPREGLLVTASAVAWSAPHDVQAALDRSQVGRERYFVYINAP